MKTTLKYMLDVMGHQSVASPEGLRSPHSALYLRYQTMHAHYEETPQIGEELLKISTETPQTREELLTTATETVEKQEGGGLYVHSRNMKESMSMTKSVSEPDTCCRVKELNTKF